MIKALAFDLDGTLWLSDAIHAGAYREVLSNIHKKFTYDKYAGFATVDAIRSFLDSVNVVELCAQKSDIAARKLEMINPIVPGVKDALNYLRKHYMLGLTSNASKANIQSFLTLNNLEDNFSIVTQSFKPAAYTVMAGELGIRKDQILAIEDSVEGIRIAKAHGLTTVAILHTTMFDPLVLRRERAVRDAGADKIVHRFSELIEWLNGG